MCDTHYNRLQAAGLLPRRPTPIERFERFVIRHDADGCWEFTSSICDGYGYFWFNGRSIRAHIWSYEHHVGPVPDGLELDHLCRNRACVRPDHLEPVTDQENSLRGDTIAAFYAARTHCANGHEYSPQNVRPRGTGGRDCRRCLTIRTQRYRANKRLRAAQEAS